MALRPTQGDEKRLLFLEAPSLPLSSRPERTRISYFALLHRIRMRFSLRKPRDANQRHES
jgi:hypothetical protein